MRLKLKRARCMYQYYILKCIYNYICGLAACNILKCAHNLEMTKISRIMYKYNNSIFFFREDDEYDDDAKS